MSNTIIENASIALEPDFKITCSKCGSNEVMITQKPNVLYGSLHADIDTQLQCSCGATIELIKGKRG